MLQVFYLDVAYVSCICCKCMFQMFHLLQTYVAFKYFMCLDVCSESHGARPGQRGNGHDEPDAGGQGAWRAWVQRTGACSSSPQLPGPVRAEREERGRREGAAGIATGAGCVCGAG